MDYNIGYSIEIERQNQSCSQETSKTQLELVVLLMMHDGMEIDVDNSN